MTAPTIVNREGAQVDGRFAKAGGALGFASPFARWVGFRINAEILRATGETDTDATVYLGPQLPAGTTIHGIMIKLNELFDAGSTPTTAQVKVGDGSNDDSILPNFGAFYTGALVWQNIQAENLGVDLYDGTLRYLGYKTLAAATQLQAIFTIANDTINDLTAGEIEVYLLISDPPQAVVEDAKISA